MKWRILTGTSRDLVVRIIIVALLTGIPAGVSMAQSEPDADENSVIEEFYLGQVARVQKKGETQLTLVVFSAGADAEESETSSDSFTKRFEVEYGITDRVELNVETGLFRESSVLSDLHDAELGLTVDLAPQSAFHLVGGVSVAPRRLSDIELRAASHVTVGRGEVHGAVSYGMEEQQTVFDLGAVYPLSPSWRGTLELQHDTEAEAVRIAPGLSWNGAGFQLGAGLALPLTGDSGSSLVVKAIYEF